MAEDGVMPEGSVPSRRKDHHVEAQWNRENAREIMREAHGRFEESVEFVPDEFAQPQKPASAHVALASAHYSLVKRYRKPWLLPIAAWHLWWAAVHARKAERIGLVNFDQVDVVSTILFQAPWWLGGSFGKAYRLVDIALTCVKPAGWPEMIPHTRALLEISCGKMDLAVGRRVGANTLDRAERHIREAISLRGEILNEPDQLMAQRQWCRVASAAGLFLWDNFSGEIGLEGLELVAEAAELAREVSSDQFVKIMQECSKRGV
jgi:hypothetical protein